MTRDEFWKLVEGARAPERDGFETAEHLREALEQLTLDEVTGFLEQQQQVMQDSYSLAMWGAAHLINGGCNDDQFERFRGWLVTQGREAFESALKDPDNLVDWAPDGEKAECEQMLYVGALAYEAATGDFPEGPAFHMPQLGKGFRFDDPAEMKVRYPRLWEKFEFAPRRADADDDSDS